MTLTAATTKSLAKPGMHGDGRGLYLRIAKGGSKGWILRIRIDGRRRDIGLGGYPAVPLAKARQLAESHRLAIAEGRDPLADRRKARVPTFAEAAAKVHEANLPRWRNATHSQQWLATMETYAFPRIGEKRLDRIERRDVLAILAPIWASKPETARRVRQRIRTVLKWAMAHDFAEHNVAGEAIDGALPSMPRIKAHFRALPYADLPAAVAMIEESAASMTATLCLRFLILTVARSGEARGAKWSEIDLDAATWTIPAARMKGGQNHRVPLSAAALAVLREAARFRDDTGLVFPSVSRAGCKMSDMSLTRVLAKIGAADRASVHGFRATFRDWAAECTSAPHAVMELSLAHVVGGAVEQAYARSDLLDRRRALMGEWGRFATASTGAKIVPLHA